MVARQPRIKKIPVLAPSTCPIDLFGPLANGTVLKRLRVAFDFALLVSYTPLAAARVELERTFGSLKPISSRCGFVRITTRPVATRCSRKTPSIAIKHGLRSHPW